MPPSMGSGCVFKTFPFLLLTRCGEDNSTDGVPVDETATALEAPELAPNRLVEDPPERRPVP